jgi:hypothetical protein
MKLALYDHQASRLFLSGIETYIAEPMNGSVHACLGLWNGFAPVWASVSGFRVFLLLGFSLWASHEHHHDLEPGTYYARTFVYATRPYVLLQVAFGPFLRPSSHYRWLYEKRNA